jgi:hypothetical protein
MKSMAKGLVSLGKDMVVGIVARGQYSFEQRCWLPKLPEGVSVHSVHYNYLRDCFDVILVSLEPITGWTGYVEDGVEIPVSPVQHEIYCKAKSTAKEPENIIKTMSLRKLIMNVENDLREDADTGVSLDMTIEEYLNNLYNEK